MILGQGKMKNKNWRKKTIFCRYIIYEQIKTVLSGQSCANTQFISGIKIKRETKAIQPPLGKDDKTSYTWHVKSSYPQNVNKA